MSIFKCSFCSFSAPYDYYGRQPPFCDAIVLLEDAYVMKDPFSASRSHLTLGSDCSVCKKAACVSQGCSIFYFKRFCLQCVSKYMDEFPQDIKEEVKKRISKDKG